MGEQDLREFLKAWLEWVEAGAPHNGKFVRSEGLCYSVRHWAELKNFPYERRAELYTSLSQALPACGCYPFGGNWRYDREAVGGLMHTNELRLDWVRSQLCQKT